MGPQRLQLSSLPHFLREPAPPPPKKGRTWLTQFLFPHWLLLLHRQNCDVFPQEDWTRD